MCIFVWKPIEHKVQPTKELKHFCLIAWGIRAYGLGLQTQIQTNPNQQVQHSTYDLLRLYSFLGIDIYPFRANNFYLSANMPLIVPRANKILASKPIKSPTQKNTKKGNYHKQRNVLKITRKFDMLRIYVKIERIRKLSHKKLKREL